MNTVLRFVAILACQVIAGPLWADAVDTATLQGAVRAAEQFLLDNGYGTERSCPADLRYKDQIGEFDMQPHCRDYNASEVKAYAVLETEVFWRVFFRKIPPLIHEGVETYRIVHVYRDWAQPDSPVRLYDIEFSLDPEATLLR